MPGGDENDGPPWVRDLFDAWRPDEVVDMRAILDARYGDDPEYQAFVAGLRRWASMDHEGAYKKIVERAYRYGETSDSGATALVWAFREGARETSDLYRGIKSPTLDYSVGLRLPWAMRSWTRDGLEAVNFSQRADFRGEPVVFRLLGDAPAFPIEGLSHAPWEREWISAGTVEVMAVNAGVSDHMGRRFMEVVVRYIGGPDA